MGVCIDQPPILEEIGNLSAYAKQLFTYQINVTNPISNPVYYYFHFIGNNFSSFSLDNITGLMNFTPQDSEEGNYTIYIWVTHNICGSLSNDSEIINFEIKLYNRAPYWINYTRNFGIFEDEQFYLNLSTFVIDPENDTIIFTHNSTPQLFPSFNLTLEGIINFTANDSDVGIHWINITATDILNFSNSSIFNFTIYNINDAPVLEPIPDLEACEDKSFYYKVNASDEDLQIPNSPEKLHFYDNTSLFVINEDTGEISFIPNFLQLGLHNIRIWVSDEEAADFKDFYLDIIEVNDAPVLQYIGAQTVYVNDSFNYSVFASDEEDGDSPSDLRFNLTFINGTKFFDIDPITGLINFTANDSIIGTYLIKVWVNDTGLVQIHPNATLTCNDGTPKSDYEIFSLTITQKNRPPNITSYYPLELNITIEETETIVFNVTVEDPDGTIPTIMWYVNDTLIKQVNSLNDTFIFITDYTSAGKYNITINASDGELSDNITWNVTVLDKPIVQVTYPPGGEMGGVIAKAVCKELWICTDWSKCQNATIPESKKLLGDKYEQIIEECNIKNISYGNCGFRTRICKDNNKCGTFINKPAELEACFYTPAPSCNDGIRNCHGPFGLCEILVDCGGPCPPCPTCSDGIQNQGEEGIDCGGPCPPCEYEYPRAICGDKKCEIREIFTCINDCSFFWILIIILTLLIAVIFIIKKEFKKTISKKEEAKLKRIKKQLSVFITRINKAILEKDITVARHYYNKAKQVYEQLPTEEKKKIYNKMLTLYSRLR